MGPSLSMQSESRRKTLESGVVERVSAVWLGREVERKAGYAGCSILLEAINEEMQ